MSQKTDKSAIADELRKILNCDIRFEKLTGEELVKLSSAVMNIGNLLGVGMRTVQSKVQSGGNQLIQGRPHLLEKVVGNSSGGFLGLGLINLEKLSNLLPKEVPQKEEA